MAAKVQTDSVSVLELAKRGDQGAIASLLTRALQSKGINVQVAQEGESLLLTLEGTQIPDQHALVPFVTKGMTHLGVESIRRLKISGRQVGQTTSSWQQEVTLGKPPVVVLDRLQDAPYGSGTAGKRPSSPSEQPVTPTGGAATAVAPTVLEDPSVQNSLTGNPIAIGNWTLHMTNQGSLVNLASASTRAVLRDRPAPTASQYCQPVTQFLDRRLETEEAIATLQRGFSVEFFGEEGMGKTALLRSLAHHPQLNAAFHDGVVYRVVRQQPVTDLIQSIFNDFFEYGSSIATIPTEAEINVAFRNKHALVVLDDVELALEAIEVLHSLPGLTFLLSSSQRYMWGDINAMPMLGLPLNDALVLLETMLGRTLAPVERPQAEALCNQLRGHPLRILQAAALMQQEQISPVTLTQLVRDSTYASPLTLKSAASLAEPERQVLAVLAALDGVPVAAEHLVALSGIQPIQSVLTTLVQRCLVLSDGDRYYLTSGGIESLRQIWDLSQWNQRVLTYVVTWAEQRQDMLDVLQTDVELLLYAARLALETGQRKQVLRLAYLTDMALFASGQWGAWEQLWQWALQSSRSLRNQSAIAYALHQLGTRALWAEDFFTAHTFLVEALQLRDALDEAAGVAVTRHNLNLLLSTPTPVEPPVEAAAPPVMASVSPINRSGLLKGLLAGGLVAIAAGAIAMLLPSLLSKPASFSLSSTRLGFGGQPINISSSEQSIRLVNTGTQPLVISSITPSGDDVGDFQVMDDCTTAPIPPGEDCIIRITFTPQAEGNRLATITILDKNGDQPEELLVSGIGEPPDTPLILSFAPGTLNFANQATGTQSQPQSINVTNTGSVPVTIDRLSLTGDQAGDFQTTSNCQGVTLDPKEICAVRVTFVPKKAASSRAVLVITARSNDLSDSSSDSEPLSAKPAPFWNIPLNGEGIAPPAPSFWRNPFGGGSSRDQPSRAPSGYGSSGYDSSDYTPPRSGGPAKLSLSSPELNFGQLAPGTNREKTLVIANTGSGTLRIDEIYITGEQAGAFEIVDNTCVGRAIAPEGGCTITFRFTANGTGDRTATLRITDNAADSPDTVAISARVGTSQPSPSPSPSPSPTVERPPAVRPTIQRFIASPSEITAGEPASLCYSVDNASSVTIAGVGNVAASADNCVTVNPSQSTTYRITAIGSDGQQATGETTVRVIQPDVGPPASPQSLTPGSTNREQAPDLLSCKNSTPLRWQAGAGGSRPASYELTLQYLSEGQQQWVTVFDGAASSGTDATPWLVQSGNYWWRWTVRSLDANGRASEPASWRYFSCFDFT